VIFEFDNCVLNTATLELVRDGKVVHVEPQVFAVLAHLAAEVIGIERHESLAAEAQHTLAELGVGNVELLVCDGSRGLPDRAPFEAIAVHATAPAPPRALLGQLAEGGRLVAPIAADGVDLLAVFRRRGEELTREEIGPCRFVPLIGDEGFAPE